MIESKKKEKDEVLDTSPPMKFIGRIKVIVDYLREDIRRGPVQFKIAIFSIFIIVTFISILVNARQLMMSMFIGMAEQSVGDSDFLISKVSFTDNTFINTNNTLDILTSNFIEVKETEDKIRTVDGILGSSSRWILPGTVYNPTDRSINTSTYIIIGDSLKEIGYSIGRALQVPPLGAAEAYIVRSVKNMAELKGDMFTMRLELLNYMRSLNILGNNTDGEISDRDLVRSLVEQFLPEDFNISTTGVADAIEQQTGINLTQDQRDTLSSGISVNTSTLIDPITDIILDTLQFETQLKAREVVDSGKGKWSDAFGNIVFVDSKYYLELFTDRILSSFRTLGTNVTDTIIQQQTAISQSNQDLLSSLVDQQVQSLLVDPLTLAFEQFNLTNRAMILGCVVDDKIRVYGSFIGYKEILIRMSNKISQVLGSPGSYTILSPMYIGFEVLGYVSIFIQNIIYMILVLLAILCVVLLSSLMVFSIDEKTYEFGMLRALGFRRNNIILMLVMQAGVFAVCGWCFGVLLSWIISTGLQILFYVDIRMLTSIRFDNTAWLVTVIFGFAIPIIVNVYSIRNSLSESLKDSLDLYHRTIGAMNVIFVKLEKLGISNTVFIVSIELTVYGFLFYYVAPYLFFLNRLDLFIYLFNSILFATIISLTVIANIFQEYLELLFMYTCKMFIGSNKPLITVVKKNLQAHVDSNRKTSMMLSLCVCFIIFSGSGIHTQVSSIVSQIIISNGADIRVAGNPLDEMKLKGFLDSNRVKNYIESYSFISSSLIDYPYVNSVVLSPQSYYPSIDTWITGVDSNYTKTFYSQYYTPGNYKEDESFSTLSNGVKDGLSPIFDNSSSLTEIDTDINDVLSDEKQNRQFIKSLTVKGVIPTGVVELTSINVDTPALMKIDLDGNTILTNFTIVHTADKVPGMSFSKYILNVMFRHDIAVSMKDYGEILKIFRETMESSSEDKKKNFFEWDTDVVKRSSYGVPKTALLLRMKDGSSEEERDVVKNGIKNMIKSSDSLLDSISLSNTADSALRYLGYLNILISALTCIIAFFMLLISLMKKIKDNVWELGVLRSMGINIRQIYLIYFIETAAVIISALLLGTGVGLAISKVSTVFYFVFFEVDLGLGFPATEFVILLSFLICTTVLTSWFGLRSFIYQPISRLLRGLV